MTDSNLSPENEKLKNTGIKNIPRVLKEKLFDNTGAIMFPEQIQSKTVADYERNIENVLRPKGQKDDQLLRGTLSAGFDLTENAINFAGRAIGTLSGNKYTAKDYFDNEALGVYIPEEDEDSFTYNLSKFGVQYGVPYTAAFKFLGSIGLSNFVWRDVLAGGTTASVFFDTFDKNLSNYLVDTPLIAPVAKLLAAKTEEESNVAAETIKKFIEGGVTQKIVNKTFDAALNPQKVADAFVDVVKTFKKSPKVANDLIFNLRQSRFNKFENIRKFNGMDEALSRSDDLVDIAPLADNVVPKADDIVLTPRKKIRSKKGKQKFQTTDERVGLEGRNFDIFSDDPKEVAKIKAAYEEEQTKYYPKYLNIVTDDMLIEDADDYLEPEVIQAITQFADKYGLKLPVLMAATVRRITGLAVNLSDNAALIKTLPIGSQEANILKQKLTLQTISFYKMIKGDSKFGTVIGRTLRARQLANAKNPVTGQTPGEVTASNIEARRAEDLKGGGSEIIRDVAEDIDNTFKSLEFSQEDVLKALEEDRFEDFADFASKLAAAHGDPFVLQKLVKESIGMKGLKIGNEVFLNGILSNPATHIRNTLGTMVNVVTGPADLLIGSSTRQDLLRGQFVDPILFRRAMAEFAMFKQAQSDALKLAGQAFKENKNILDRSRMIVDSGNDPTQRFAIQKRGGTFDGEGLQKIKSGKNVAQYLRKGLVPDLINSFGTINNAPLRGLIAEDEYNKQLAFRMFLKGELVEDGLRKGLTGKAFDDYVDKSFELGVNWIAKKGSELDLALKEIQEFKPFIGPNGAQVAVGEDLFLKIRDSLDYAADRTFTTKIDNKLVNALKHPGWKPVLPFINSPLNIQQTLLRRTPFMATITSKVPLLEGMLDTHRKQLQSSIPSVSGRARGVERIGAGVWLTFATLSMAAIDRFAKIALVDGSDPDWRQDKIRKYSGDPGYAFRILLTNPVTKKPQLGPDGQPKYHFVDCGRIGLEPFSSMCRVAGYYGTIQKYLDDEDQKNVAAVMTVALARDILDLPMFEAVQKLMDIIENKPDALPNFLANYMNSAFIPFSSLRKAIKKTDYSYIDPRSGKKLRGYFKPDKSIQKGDYIKQNIRTKFDDGTPIPEDHPAYGTLVQENPRFVGDFFVRKVALKFMKELQSSNPLAERLKPQKFWLTGQNLEYPQNIGINSGMNPSVEGASLNDPVVSLVRRSKSKITPPPAHLFRNSAEGGILLNSTQYEKLKEFIYETKLDNNNPPRISSKGKTVYQKLLPIAKDKKILELLDFIESGEVDDNFNIDTKAVLTSRENSVKDLRKLLRQIITPYIGQAKLQLFQLEDEKGGAKSLLPAYLREKKRQKLDLQNRYTR